MVSAISYQNHRHMKMLCPYQLHCLCTNLRYQVPIMSISSLNQHYPQSSGTGDSQELLRKHNSKSTAFLLHQLSRQQHPKSTTPTFRDLEDQLSDDEKVKILELSLVRRRTPQFPGSIYVQSPSDPDVASSLPPLQTLFQDIADDDDEDEEMIMRALAIRRKVTQEIFKEAMKKGKFGITYTTNLAERLTDFFDYVIIEAASLKRIPEFSRSTFYLRAKTVFADSNVVSLIRWLKHHSLTYPQIAKLICNSRGKLESIRRVAEWLKSVRVKDEFLGLALTKSGDNILERSNENLDEIVDYIESKGVRKEWMGYVISRCPRLLSCNLEEVKDRVEFYTDMGMDAKDFGTMVFDFPKVLGGFTLEEMTQKVSFLKDFGLKTEDVGRLIAFRPELMACSIEERWKPLVKYFDSLGITKDGMRRILVFKPMVFCFDLETTIVAKVKFFREIGVREDAIGNMLVKFPTLMTYSLYKKIRPVVIFLLTKAGVSEKGIGKVIALGPELLGCKIVHKLEVNVKYFLSLGIRLQQLGEMIADFPMLLRYNVEILRPKYQYLRRTMKRPLEDLIEFPRFFSYSLEGRIIPRHKIMVENQMNCKLRYMLAATDEEFKKMVEATQRKQRQSEYAIIDDAFHDLNMPS